MSNFFFELGIEEIPTSQIENLIAQLKVGFETKLQEELIDHKHIETYCTNRRFTIFISKISPRAKDKINYIQGPPEKIAYDKDKKPTLALQKFLASKKIQLSDITITKTPKGPYITYKEVIKGNHTKEILKKIISQILSSLKFNKVMCWNDSRVPFIRPIKNFLALYNKDLLDIKFAGITSSKYIRGHPLLSEEPILVQSFKDYIEQLQINFVILGEKERKEKILSEIQEYENDLEIKCDIVDHLIYYHTFNNEYPVVFYGEFDQEYLNLPNEIISTFMINEKKLFPTYDQNGNLKNIFIGVSNVPDENEYVSSGNMKIIKATFEDAKFFWETDKQRDFLKLRESLHDITFHKGAGSFYEKTQRLKNISLFILKLIDFDPKLEEPLKIAALNCKNDLSTQMVREFPSLQGIMGGLYYKEAYGKDKNDIYSAIYDHYSPKGFADCPKFSKTGVILALADKIDNITTLIPKGIKVSGSKDPYGLRRDGNAIIKIIIDNKLNFNLDKLLDFCLKDLPKHQEKFKDEITHFFKIRTENCFKDILNFGYYIVNGILSESNLDISDIYLKAKQLSQIKNQEAMTILISLHKRIRNILKKSEDFEVDTKLLKENAEKILYEITSQSTKNIQNLIKQKNYITACSKIIEMKPIVDQFFDEILVMTEDKKIRQNRLGLLQLLDKLISNIANFTLISK